jgi:AcrR family transcriptional regulator
VPGSNATAALLREAALACISRYGVAKTTIEDVAAEAGLSRAAAYRACPGGKDALIAGVFLAEAGEVVAAIRRAADAASDLGSALAAAMSTASRRLGSIEALRFVLRYEPELVLPHLSFAGLDRFLAAITAAAAPALHRFLPPAEAERAAELCARIFVSHFGNPDPELRLSDPEHTRRLVEAFVLPTIPTPESDQILHTER